MSAVLANLPRGPIPTLMSVLSKIRGCIVGGALGDTVGLFTEFLSSAQSVSHYGPTPRFSLVSPAPPGFKTTVLDRHRCMFEEGAWTDDTDQSLLILMSFLRSGGASLDPIDFAVRLRHWVAFGFRPLERLPLGLGKTVGSVVRSSAFLDDPIKCSTEIWERGRREMAANGAVMRTAVVGALLFKNQEQMFSSAIGIASTTHADPRCLVSCTIVSALIAAIIKDELRNEDDIRRIVDLAILPVTKLNPPLEAGHLEELHAIIWKDTLKELQLDEPRSIGYTYKCLASGVWALRQGLSAAGVTSGVESTKPSGVFERLITELAMAGGDADTNCAVAGSLLGALFGYDGLPSHWLEGLKHREWLVAKADAAHSLIEGTGRYDFENDVDTLVDGGKGDMPKEELDARWKVLTEAMHRRMGDFEKLERLQKGQKKGDKKDNCIIS